MSEGSSFVGIEAVPERSKSRTSECPAQRSGVRVLSIVNKCFACSIIKHKAFPCFVV